MASVTLRYAQKENKKAKSEHSFPPFFFFIVRAWVRFRVG